MKTPTVARITFKNDTFGLDLADIRLITNALEIIQPDSEFMANRARNLASAFEAIEDACEDKLMPARVK